MDYELIKAGSEHYILGLILRVDTPDKEFDTVSETEIGKCIAKYNAGPKRVKRNHETFFDPSQVEVVESYQAPCDMAIAGGTARKGDWLVKFRVSEEIYKLAAAGQVTGFSIGGRAKGE